MGKPTVPACHLTCNLVGVMPLVIRWCSTGRARAVLSVAHTFRRAVEKQHEGVAVRGRAKDVQNRTAGVAGAGEEGTPKSPP